MAEEAKFGTAISCIDGRVQRPIADWIKERYSVEFVDMVTEPGSDKAVSSGGTALVNAVRDKVRISVQAHHSKVVAVSGHYECAANPVSREEHLAQVQGAARVVASWGVAVTVVGLWVGPNWQAELVVVLPEGSRRKG